MANIIEHPLTRSPNAFPLRPLPSSGLSFDRAIVVPSPGLEPGWLLTRGFQVLIRTLSGSQGHLGRIHKLLIVKLAAAEHNARSGAVGRKKELATALNLH
jgi:hypothetical protein